MPYSIASIDPLGVAYPRASANGDTILVRQLHTFGDTHHHWTAKYGGVVGYAETRDGAIWHLTEKLGGANIPLPNSVIIVEVDSE